VRRCFRGNSEPTNVIARSRSKIQYAAVAKTKNPDERLDRLRADRDRAVDDAAGGRQLVEPLLQPDEELVLDPRRVLRLLVELLLGGRHAADRLVDLVDRARDREPQQQPDRAHDRDVVQRYSQRPRDPVLREPLDPGSHRRGDDEAEEDEREHDLHLPERQSERDDRDRYQSRDEGFASDVGHCKVVAVFGGLQTQE
jgi:hypothetical protein